MAPVGRSRGGACGFGLAGRTLGRPRGPALRALRPVCREPAGPPERGSLRAASAARGQCGGFGRLTKTPRWSAERRGSPRRRLRRASQACAGPRKPGGRKPGRLSALRPPRNFAGDYARKPGASRRGRAGRTPASHNQEKSDVPDQGHIRAGPDARAAQGPRRTLARARTRGGAPSTTGSASGGCASKPPCRRNRTCSSDMHACFTRHWSLVPEERKEYLRGCIDGGARRAIVSKDAHPSRRRSRGARQVLWLMTTRSGRRASARRLTVEPVARDRRLAPDVRIRRL